MTDLAAALLKDVPRFAGPDGNLLAEEDVLAALSAHLDAATEKEAMAVLAGSPDPFHKTIAREWRGEERAMSDGYWVLRGEELVRVEGDPGVDGIECRDATIKELDEQIAALRAERDDARKWAAEQHACADRYAARALDAEAEVEKLRRAMKQIAFKKPEPIGDTGFQQGPLALWQWAQKIARTALTTEKRHD